MILASESTSVSNDSFALFMLSEELLLKIGRFASIEAMRNLIATCKYIRNQLNTWFLQLLALKNNPDRATSGFIVDAIGNKGDTCLWCNEEFFIRDHHAIPNDLSIHLFVNPTAKKISSDEVRSMIIQLSGSPESYEDSRQFLKFLFLEVSFKKLKCLMVCGVELSNEFSQEIGALNLDAFHMRNFSYHTDFAVDYFFQYCNSLKTLYVVHPDRFERVYPPKELKKLVIYCPKSSKDMIERRKAKSSKDMIERLKAISTQLCIDMDKCHALKEM